MTNRVIILWLLRTFGECQLMSQLIARGLLVPPLINQRIC